MSVPPLTTNNEGNIAVSNIHGSAMGADCAAAGVPTSSDIPTAIASYDFTARDADEVSFQKGDTLVNIMVDPEDDGWLRGTVPRTGRSGSIPASYVIMQARNVHLIAATNEIAANVTNVSPW